MDLIPLIVGLILGLLLGALAALVVLARRAASAPAGEQPALVAARHETALLAVRHDEAAQRADLHAQLAAMESSVDGLHRQLRDAETRYRDLIDRQAAASAEQQRHDDDESRVLQALAPVTDSLASMRVKVAELEHQRAVQHGQLAEQLRNALESEERLRGTAESLAAALRSNSVRGVWGETQLRRVVEAAGLLQHVDFDLQTSVVTGAGGGRPDLVVHLPGGRSIAVDAKVPFAAYLEASAIPASAGADEQARRAVLLKAHVKALQDHVTALGAKTYWEGLGASPELVVAFIPSESLVSSALEADPGLLEFAFARRVAIASPVTLWSLLKTVAYGWQQDVVTAEATALFEAGRELHGRLGTMAGHVEKLGRSLERGVKDYNLFVGSLERQVLPSARKLTRLDPARTIAPLPVVEESRRELVAYELLAELESTGPAMTPGLGGAGSAR